MTIFLQPLRAISLTVSCNRVSCVEAVGEGTGLMAGFEDLAEVVLGEDDGILLLYRVHHGEADVEQIGSERQMRPVLFDDAERQHANALRLMDSGNEIGSGQLLPMRGQTCLRTAAVCEQEETDTIKARRNTAFIANPPLIRLRCITLIAEASSQRDPACASSSRTLAPSATLIRSSPSLSNFNAAATCR